MQHLTLSYHELCMMCAPSWPGCTLVEAGSFWWSLLQPLKPAREWTRAHLHHMLEDWQLPLFEVWWALLSSDEANRNLWSGSDVMNRSCFSQKEDISSYLWTGSCILHTELQQTTTILCFSFSWLCGASAHWWEADWGGAFIYTRCC